MHNPSRPSHYKELIATLLHAHNKRVARSKGKDRRGQIPDMLSIHVRPPEIEDRQFPGHWEGDLIKGEGNARAVRSLVERTSRLVMLVKLPEQAQLGFRFERYLTECTRMNLRKWWVALFWDTEAEMVNR